MGVVLFYVVSYGPALAYCVHTQANRTYNYEIVATKWDELNAVITVYRPLALVAPRSYMRKYSELCGLSDIEAFFFVELMRSGAHLPLQDAPRTDRDTGLVASGESQRPPHHAKEDEERFRRPGPHNQLLHNQENRAITRRSHRKGAA